MATILLVKESILALKDRTGSSLIAINKWIESEKKVRRKGSVLEGIKFKFGDALRTIGQIIIEKHNCFWSCNLLNSTVMTLSITLVD